MVDFFISTHKIHIGTDLLPGSEYTILSLALLHGPELVFAKPQTTLSF